MPGTTTFLYRGIIERLRNVYDQVLIADVFADKIRYGLILFVGSPEMKSLLTHLTKQMLVLDF